jgi:hypothetical protein
VSYQPLDLTPAEIPKPKPIERGMSWRERRDRQDHNDQERYERQAAARVNKGIDWSVCIVPGCGGSLVYYGKVDQPEHRRDSTLELPICFKHMAVVWNQAVRGYTKNPKFIEAIADVNTGVQDRLVREYDAEREAHLARTDGDIYFIRLGELVKVGWTRDLAQRLKSYGASAQLLVSYPATRDDETNLHRQLRPALAKGREWYEDGAIIQHFIDEALAKYGEPRTFDYLWTQPKAVVGSRRRR